MLAAAAALAMVAVVAQDPTALRAAPSDNAAQQAQLWQGELLEVRGAKLEHLQVWDHKRERAGWVRASQVRPLDLQPANAPQLLAVLRFLRDTPGAESLGIAYVAAYLKAAPAGSIDAEPFDALGTMAERLARRASKPAAGATTSAHLEAVAGYGVHFTSYESEGAIKLCYDGEAFRRALALPASAEQRARAALAMTRHDCIDPALPALQRRELDRWRAGVLDELDTASLPALTRNRLHLRRAGVWSAIAFDDARSGDGRAAAQRALDELAAVDKIDLADDDQADFTEAALRVGASRWAALAGAAPASRLILRTEAGEPGQTCVSLSDARGSLARRCTWGVVHAASARASTDGRSFVLAVQPLATWRELWVFRARRGGWTVDVLPPAAAGPGVGYAEFAGFAPDGRSMLVVRESRAEGRFRRSFEVVSLATLETSKQAGAPQALSAYGKWADATWKRTTLALR